MAHKNIPHTETFRTAQRFEWLTKYSANTKAQGLDDSQKHSADTQKTKVTSSYIKSVSVVSNSLGLIIVSIAIQCRILF
jgi:hypothetical protein